MATRSKPASDRGGAVLEAAFATLPLLTPPPSRPSVKEWGASFALFALLTAAMTWPFAHRLRVIDAGDSAYFTWAIGWQIHALKTAPSTLPHGNFYAPSRNTFFMDEPILGTGVLVLPFSFFTDDAILLLNLARLLTFVLTGLFTWRLARDIGLGNPASFAAGAFFAFSPIRVDQVAHVSTLGTQWIPLVYLFARRFCLAPSSRDGVLTGFMFALSFLACGYHGLFLAVLLPLSLIPFLFSSQARQILAKGGLAVATAALLLYPLYAFSREALGPLRFERSAVDTLKYAASLETFVAANRWNRVWGGLTENFRGDPSNLFPGLMVLILAAIAVIRIRGTRFPASRSVIAVLIILGVGAAALALGPQIRLQGVSVMPGPFSLLRDHVSVFSNIRATSRAGIFCAFALAVLAGIALDTFRRAHVLSALALAGFLAEARIAPIPTPAWTNVIWSRAPVPRVYQWLKEQPAGSVVAELPARLASDYSRPAFHDSIYMVRSTLHWQPLVNGFAGAETPLIRRFRATAPSFPESSSLAVLKEAGTRFVVVHLRGYGPKQRERLETQIAQMKEQVREIQRFVNPGGAGADVDVVYELIGS